MQVAASPAAGVALCGHSMHLIVGLQRTQHEFRNVGAQFWASLGACSFHFAIKAAVLGHVVAAIYAFSVAARAVMDREHAAMRDVAGVQAPSTLLHTARTRATGDCRKRAVWYSITLCCTTASTMLPVTASGGDWRARLEIKQAISSLIIPLLSHS